MTQHAMLPDRAVFAIAGEDMRDFLQGLITKDSKSILPGKAVFSVLLSPQGRFLFDFFITEKDGRLLVETDKARLPDLIRRLSLYRLRSRVRFEPLELQVAAIWGTDVPPEGETNYSDPRLPELGWRVLFTPAAGGELEGGTQGNYELHRMSMGVPEGVKDLIIDRSILLEYGYDELHAIDFGKGCYVGQEVTARSKHRASLRKFIHIVTAKAPLAEKGTPVMAGEREAGHMAGSLGRVGLAHLSVAEVERAAREKTPLVAGGVRIEAQLPPWCETKFAV